MTDPDPIPIVVVGAGKWARECWAPLLDEQRHLYTVRAVVDPRPSAAAALGGDLHLPAENAYADLDSALAGAGQVHAGVVLTGPDQHAAAIVALAERGLHVLTEKPLATSADHAEAISAAVRGAGVKAAVVQNYRYETRIQRFRQLLRSGELGPLSHLVARFAADYRVPESWDVGDAHQMPDPLLLEGAVHHLDMIRYLTGSEITSVSAITANPPWSSFAGPAVAAVLLALADGTIAVYEGTLLAAGQQRRWHREHYRAECRDGSLTLTGNTLDVHRDGGLMANIPVPADHPRHGHRATTRASPPGSPATAARDPSGGQCAEPRGRSRRPRFRRRGRLADPGVRARCTGDGRPVLGCCAAFRNRTDG
jgi:predicted dehydrogenase